MDGSILPITWKMAVLTRLIVLSSVCFVCTIGFMCHICSYSADNSQNTKQENACVYQPEQLPPTMAVKCGNFCVTSEQWRIKAKKVQSFFRTCSTDWGNDCISDGWDIICKSSCKGEFCGTKTVGGRHGEHSNAHSNKDDNGSSSNKNGWSAVICACAFVMWILK